ncbi:sensor histidine kinase [Clostridium beijerinckii]|nr:histidine kinase [Clostridium beijerinckii]NRU37816.1 signal transduction histidine kinase [Clostridium beijerinckii]NSA98906.1 signal transduction histidine kinase [Clostridium beijerinckii]OOM70624.1 sensor histidine kinase DesK [Clostridium beijerinckii]CUU49628.1 Integral membrane sensor signal transduction histidine kinase [Clostridium beijerinckii]
MNQFDELLWKNEMETNKTVSKAMRIVLYFCFAAGFLNLIHVFDAVQNVMVKMNVLLIIPLLLPTILVDIFELKKSWIKYFILTCAVISTGICYTLLTFQTVLMFVIPTILASMYFRKKQLIVVIIESVFNIVIAHLLSSYFLMEPWVEPFTGLKNIMLYGAVPRILQYLCCGCLFYILCNRTSGLMLNYHKFIKDKEVFELEKSIALQKIKYEEREQVSRDIHNSVGHTIMAAIMSLDAAEAVYNMDSKKAIEKIKFANIRMRESLEAIRKAVRGVNTKENGQTIEDVMKLINVNIDKLKEDFNIKIRAKMDYSEQQLKTQSICIERIDFLIGALQELVTNSVKHGNATAIIVIINVDRNNINIIVQDNGTGIESMRNYEELLDSGFGIKKIRNYLFSIGGILKIENQEGLLVMLKIPTRAGD